MTLDTLKSISIALLGLGISLGLSCKTSEKPSLVKDDSSELSPEAEVAYPIDPKVHLETEGDPLDPSSYQKYATNVVAYARYALGIASGQAFDPIEAADVMVEQYLEFAKRLELSPTVAFGYFMIEANQEAEEIYRLHLNDLLKGEGVLSKLPKQNVQVLTIKKQMQSCQAASGLSPKACCQNLLFPWALIGAYSDLEMDKRTALNVWLGKSNFYDAFRQALPAEGSSNLFRLLGLKAWVSACNGAVTDAPADLRALEESLHYHESGSLWQTSLHPISRAKFAGRRIYRHPHMKVSIAESLDKDCKVMETEIVSPGPGLSKLFWTFNREGAFDEAGQFPDQKGGQAIKYTPDSCMGCHYTFDKRHFSVRAPSFKALHLLPREINGKPNWRDDSRCQLPGEELILHKDEPLSLDHALLEEKE